MIFKSMVLACFVFCCTSAIGQQFSVQSGYTLLFSKHFDQLIRTYNDSRPFLKNKQPLLSDGVHFLGTYYSQRSKLWKSGVSVGSSVFTSSANNPDINVRFSLHQLELGYILRYKDSVRPNGFYGEVGSSAAFEILGKRINGAPLFIDDKKEPSFQWGVLVKVNIGYGWKVSKKLELAPNLGVHFAPYHSIGKSEIVINQTNGIVPNVQKTFLRLAFGVRLFIH